MANATHAVLVAHNGGLFGAERSVLALASGLHDNPTFRVLVAVPHEGPLAAACRERGIGTVISQHRQWLARKVSFVGVVKRLVRNLMALVRTDRTLREFEPDVVYTGTGSTPFGALLARRWRIPHVWHLREFGEQDYGAAYDWGPGRCYQFLNNRADRLIANSEAVRAHFVTRLDRSDIRVVYNGFSFDPAQETDRETIDRSGTEAAEQPELVLVGALVEGKGQHDAIRALAVLARWGRYPRLVLAGSGDPDYAQRLQDLVDENGLTEQVQFAGFVDDPEPLYRDAALTLVCSRCEGFGRTAVESLRAGTPVIGTDAGGLPEIVDNGDTGLLYPGGDAQALAAAIDALLADPERYARMAANGPPRMRQRFDQDRYIRALGAIIRGAAQPSRKPTQPAPQQGVQ